TGESTQGGRGEPDISLNPRHVQSRPGTALQAAGAEEERPARHLLTDMSEREPRRSNPNIPDYLRNPEQDGRVLLPESLKEGMPALYSQEHEPDPMVVCKFFDPVGSWTWYATEGSPVDEDGYYVPTSPR